MEDNYYSLFDVTKESLYQLIKIALSKGGDYADIFFEHSIANEISLRDNQVNSAGNHIDFGVGIRVLCGDQTGYAYSESTNIKEMESAALMAAQIAESKTSFNHTLKINPIKVKNRYPILNHWEDYSITKKTTFLQQLNQSIFDADSRVDKVIEQLSDSNTKIMFFNSLGDFFCDERPLASAVVSCVMKQGSRIETSSSSRSYRMGSEMLTGNLVKEMVDEVIKNTSILFKAKQPKGGVLPVIMGAGGSGILLHEAIGHAFEADFNRKKTSIFSDRLGEKICKESINVVDDGTITGNRGALNIDDEGIPGQKTYIVKNGILNSYLHDRISAKYYRVHPTGNGRRESFRFSPIPRMRATYMENGNSTENDIIKSVKKGIYVDNFSNGQVQIGAGDFTFYVKSGFLVENGELTYPIKDINIIGNGPETLLNIEEVADNNIIDNGTWTCGKSQYCNVSCGMPTILVKHLTVGGCN